MTLANLMNQPVTIRRRSPGSVDDYGNPATTTTATEATVGYLTQVATAERVVDRDTVAADWLLYLPAGTGIDATDQVVAEGVTFEVVGAPNRARNPRTRSEHHVEVSLRTVTG